MSELLDVTHKIENTRGFKPPVFVDVRFNRSVRAAGFRDRMFEKSLGPDRYVWLQSLGNAAIGRQDGSIEINDPAGAEDLLDLALELNAKKRRAIFFCSCGSPTHCHRNQVTQLLLASAKRRKVSIEVIEWPGGEPLARPVADVLVSRPVFNQLLRDRAAVPLSSDDDIETLAALPWGSIVTVPDGDRSVPISVGPAFYRAGAWSMPIFVSPVEIEDDAETIAGRVPKLRRELRYAIMR